MTDDRRLTDEQLSEMLTLLQQVDTVELKLTIPDAESRTTLKALELDPLDAQIRQVVFFDTPDLVLNRHGLVVRARRSQNAEDDSVIKLRPVVPSELPEELRRLSDFGVEVDAMPGGFVCSASYKGKIPAGNVRQVIQGNGEIRKLFSKPQRTFFESQAPEGVTLDSLSVLGPITVLKVKFEPEQLRRRMVAEMWFYPDGSRILELSSKAEPATAFQAVAELRAFLAGRQINLTGEQQTKTKTALEYYAAQL